ncbi:MAG: hypothetical protein Hyperionvirus4_82 [Hyperionvirus sp.]|uniref:Protein kinase domain-containing protein n=1 Tax=Hyperionvirus sp. TaxID=2487770 RepID=A0A3G5A7A2_9VIRU|nr:MAG: hypothetical protein Hyperionvirus4_82 [Hyperionvirus sp.]
MYHQKYLKYKAKYYNYLHLHGGNAISNTKALIDKKLTNLPQCYKLPFSCMVPINFDASWLQIKKFLGGGRINEIFDAEISDDIKRSIIVRIRPITASTLRDESIASIFRELRIHFQVNTLREMNYSPNFVYLFNYFICETPKELTDEYKKNLSSPERINRLEEIKNKKLIDAVQEGISPDEWMEAQLYEPSSNISLLDFSRKYVGTQLCETRPSLEGIYSPDTDSYSIYTLLEKADTDLRKIASELDPLILMNIYQQTIISLEIAYASIGLIHNDLIPANIFIKYIPKDIKYFQYGISGKRILLNNLGYLVLIGDFGESRTNTNENPDISAKERVNDYIQLLRANPHPALTDFSSLKAIMDVLIPKK